MQPSTALNIYAPHLTIFKSPPPPPWVWSAVIWYKHMSQWRCLKCLVVVSTGPWWVRGGWSPSPGRSHNVSGCRKDPDRGPSHHLLSATARGGLVLTDNVRQTHLIKQIAALATASLSTTCLSAYTGGRGGGNKRSFQNRSPTNSHTPTKWTSYQRGERSSWPHL